jgi:hypothetical protein
LYPKSLILVTIKIRFIFNINPPLLFLYLCFFLLAAMSTSKHHHLLPGDEHVRKFPRQAISKLVSFSGLILSIIIIIYSLIRIYILEGGLLQRLYGKAYSQLNETNRRGFLNHHIAGATKLLILILAAYPFITVAFTKENFHKPYVHGSKVTMGDMLIVAARELLANKAYPFPARFRRISQF